MDKTKRLSPSVTLRRGNLISSILTSALCRFLLYAGIIFFAGVLAGVYMDGYFLWNRSRLFSKKPAHDRVPKEEEKGQPGLSIKKDLSIQFRDYVPRHVFVDSSYGAPHSLELFFETYPDAHKYTVFAFLADGSYKDLYAKFPNVTLYPGTVPSTKKGATTIVLPQEGLRKKANHSLPITMLNFSAWLKDSVQPDEYVVVKLTTDPQNEEQIVKQLVSTGAVEWIDKFYTTTADADVLEIAKEKFSTRGDEVLLWDDGKYSYSDFDEVNPPRIDKDDSVKISTCRSKNATRFALLLYFSKVNKHAYAGMELLRKRAKKSPVKLPPTLFIPPDYSDTQSHCNELSSMASHMGLGIYWQDSFFSDIKSDDTEVKSNRIRNKFVSAENCFLSSNLTLNYTLTKAEMLKTEVLLSGKKDKNAPEEDKAVKEVMSDRGYTALSNVRDVTYLTTAARDTFKKVFAEKDSKGLSAIDISVPGTDVFVLELLNAFISNFIPIHLCH